MEFAIFICNFATVFINANSPIMEDNIAVRLKLFLDSKGIPSTQGADLCGIPRPSFSQLLSGRNQKVSDAIIGKLHAAFPDLSIMWLMFGEGSMLHSENDDIHSSSDDEIENSSSTKEDFSRVGKNASENANLNALTMADSAINPTMIQQFEDNKKILELQLQIDKLVKNPRRVTQITVYYDDSTFETFIPSRQ